MLGPRGLDNLGPGRQSEARMSQQLSRLCLQVNGSVRLLW